MTASTAEKFAARFAGVEVEYLNRGEPPDYEHSILIGRVVGWCAATEEVILEVPADHPGLIEWHDRRFVATYKRSSEDLVMASVLDVYGVPAFPKRPTIKKFPHICPRCEHKALIIFSTVDCSNWECPSYYQLS